MRVGEASVEIQGLGGDAFERAVHEFGEGAPITYRGMTLLLRPAELEVRVPTPAGAGPVTPSRALDLLTRARYRLGALLASAAPLEASVGNRVPRLVLVHDVNAETPPLYELRGDHLRRVAAEPTDD
ncbi:MAG TPA: hypothetical protein VFS08_05900 [Gemmatimonadaceae bacterium]|nr:hypothetical protein [Gemmatimonadaceae bacterium]